MSKPFTKSGLMRQNKDTVSRYNSDTGQVEAKPAGRVTKKEVGGILRLSDSDAETILKEAKPGAFILHQPSADSGTRIRLTARSSFNFETEKEVTLYAFEVDHKPGMGRYFTKEELHAFLEEII